MLLLLIWLEIQTAIEVVFQPPNESVAFLGWSAAAFAYASGDNTVQTLDVTENR